MREENKEGLPWLSKMKRKEEEEKVGGGDGKARDEKKFFPSFSFSDKLSAPPPPLLSQDRRIRNCPELTFAKE